MLESNNLCKNIDVMRRALYRTLSNIDLVRGFTTNKGIFNMSRIFVRSIPDEDKLTIQLKYGEEGKQPKQFSLLRDKHEDVKKALDRLKLNIGKKVKKKKKKKGKESASETVEEESDEIDIKFVINGLDVTESMTINETFGLDGAKMMLNNTEYNVYINSPTITKLSFPKNIMEGFPIFPKVELEFCELKQCEFVWNRVPQNFDCTQKPEARTEVCKSFVYIPSLTDLGYKLELLCTPKLGSKIGEEVSVLSTDVVGAGPGVCPFEARHLYTTDRTGNDEFRIVTYNILADVFADTEFTKTQLYPYCAPYALKLDYRMQLILKELQGYNSDIICLQEVDRKVFTKELSPALENLGFEGMFKEKNGNMREGEAIFFRTSKFRYLTDHSIILTDTLKTDCNFEGMLQKVTAFPDVMNNLERRSNILQVVILESVDHPGRKVCVANTHLFFHHAADHIRILQGVICIKHLEHVLRQYQDQGDELSLVFCGDFNANPNSGLHQFFMSGRISSEHHHMIVSNTGEKLHDMEFFHSLKLESAGGYPLYTNYVGNFSGHLDYTFIDSSLVVSNVVPQPQHEEVVQHVALPSVVFPSDHIAQICDVKWKALL